jgi:hypothetical protein
MTVSQYKVTYVTPFDNTPQETTVEVKNKYGTSEEQIEKAIKDRFIKQTMLVKSVEKI